MLLALAGLAPVPAQAQVEDYISNLRTPWAAVGGVNSVTIDGSRRRMAQPFETGSESGGYPLQEVVLLLSRVAPEGLKVTIRENSVVGGNNVPGEIPLYTLTSPASLSDGRNTFTAPPGATLAADTRYYIVAERVEGADSDEIAQWNRLRYRGGGAPTIDNAGGWEINFDYQEIVFRIGGGSAQWEDGNQDYALAAAVRGGRPQVTVASDGDVKEDSPAVFTLTRTGDTTHPLVVAYEVTATGEFGVTTTDAGTATFLANNDTVQVSVATTGDSVHETHGSVTLTLQAGTGYAVGTPDTATAAVEDDDNAAPTGGPPTIDDTTPLVGEVLMAITSGIDDPDGLTNRRFTYQWIRTSGGTDTRISRATAATYAVVAADRDATLKVEVKFTDDDGTEETLTSAPTATVGNSIVWVTSDGDVTEGDPAVWTLRRTGSATGMLRVAFDIDPDGGDFGLTAADGTTFPVDSTTEDEATFPAGSSTTQVSLSTVNDSTHEADGTVSLIVLDDHFRDGSYSTGEASEGQPEFADLTIRDNDNAAPTGAPTIDDTTPMAGETLTADASGITDPDGLTVTDKTFTWQWIRVASDNTETEITGATSETYTVGAADVGATLKVAATFTDDDGTEETVESAATSAVAAAAVTLPTVTVARVSTPVEEGEGAQFTVTRTVVTTGALTVNYRVSETDDMVAAGDEDAQTVAFADGDTEKTVTVPTVEDSVHEADSTVTVTLTADTVGEPTYLLGASTTAEVAVEDDDNAAPTGAPTIDDTTPVVTETLTADASGIDDPDGLTSLTDFTWQWLRVPSGGGTPTEITGATTASYTVVAEDVGATLKVRAGFTDDDDTGETVESAETATVTPYTITAASPTVTEGDDGAPLLRFVLSRSETGQRVELGWRVATESTAQATGPMADFAGSMAGTLVFSPSSTSGQVFFQVRPDTVDESDETVVLELFEVAGTPEGVTFPSTVTGTIVDDDTATLSIGPSSVSVDEGDSGTTDLVFTVSMDLQSDREVTVEYDVGGTAESGADYEAPTPARVTFPALSQEVPTMQTITFRVRGDTDAERDETVEVELRDPSGGAALGTARAEGTIRNDDEPVLSVTPSEVDEGDSTADRVQLTFRVTMSGQSDTDVTVDYRVDTGAGTATVGTDYRNQQPGTARIESGDTGVVVRVRVNEDTEFELDETVVMVFENPVGAELDPDSARVTGTILNDDLPPVTVAAVAATVTEGEAAAFRLRRPDLDTSEALVVSFTVVDPAGVLSGTAPATATIAAGETEETVSLDTVDDGDHEAHGSVTLTLAAGAAYVLGPEAERSAEVTVRDNDDSPATGSVTVTGTATEGQTLTAEATNIVDADGLDNAVYAWQWVRTPSGGGDEDITGATSETYVPAFADAGATLKARLTVTDDEGHDATFESAATSAVAALPRPLVTVASDGDVTEGATVTFTLTRTVDTTGTLDVAYAVTASGDFGATTGAGTATFPANSATVRVSVDTTGDGAHEAHGSVTVTLTADTGADPAWLLGDPSTATAAVEDDDDSPASGTVTVTGTATEGQTLTADTSGLTDADGLDNAAYAWQWVRTPSGGSDEDISGATSQTYVPVFADAGATLKVRVTVTDDEGHEATFTSAPTSAVAALPRVSVVHGGSPITEGGDATFTFTLSKTIGDIPLRVNIRRTETGNMMFPNNLGRSVVVFGPNQTTLTVSYPTVDDDTTEPNSTVTVEVLERNYYMPGTPSMASIEVRDDDDSPATGSVTVTGTATEGETLTADTSGLTDEDGLDNASYAYQWVRTPAGGSDADISGATGATYVPVFADAGATLKVRVTVTDDEGHEATFTSAPTSAVAARARPSVTVVSDGDVTEGDTVTFTLMRTGDPAQTLNVAYDVTATGDFGVTTGAGTATFLASNSTVQVSVPTTGDDTHEAHGSVTLTLTADTGTDPAYLLGDPSTATAAVEDDDDSPATGSVTVTGTPTEGETLTADTSGIADEDGLNNAAYVYQWVRTPSGGSDADISGATSQTYVPVFADAGATLKVKVTVTDDEGHEASFTSAPTSAVAAASRPSVTVVSDGDVTEGSPAEFTLTRTGDPAQTLDVDYTVTVSGDFGATTGAGTATFPANSATVQVSVPTTDDSAHEAHGSVTLTLTADTSANPAYLLGDPSTATAEVRDDDNAEPTGEPTIDDTTPEVGQTLTVNTSSIDDPDGLATPDFTWQWIRVPSGGGTETRIGDATAASYTVVAADEGATLKVEVGFTDDGGTTETLTSAATMAVEAAAPTVPEVSIVPGVGGSLITEGGRVTFTLTISEPPAALLLVNLRVTETGDMMTANNLQFPIVAVFPDGKETATLSFPTVADDTDEPNSTVTAEIVERAGSNYVPGTPSMASVEVRDDDRPDGNAAPTGRPTIDDTTPAVGETLTAAPSDLDDPDGLTSPTYAWRWIRVASGGVETVVGTGMTYVVVAADAGARLKVEATFTDDAGIEETVESEATSAVEVVLLPTVSVAPVSTPVAEGAGAQFRVTRTVVTAGALTVNYGVSETGDMVASGEEGAKSVAFADGDTEQTVTVPTEDDTGHEADSTVTLTLTADAAWDLGTATAEVKVEDNDNADLTGAPTISDTTPVVGDTLTADPSGIADPDGLTGAIYAWRWIRVASDTTETEVGTGTTYTVVDADMGATLKVEATFTDDDGTEEMVESAETATVEATPLLELSIADASVDEGDTGSTTLEFTLTLDSAATETVTVDWATSDGTATAGTDYTAGTGTLTINTGDSSGTVSVTVLGDEVDEPHETFEVTLTNPSGATLGDDTATGTITDDDDPPTVTLVLTPASIAEAAGQSTVTATLDHPSSEETTVTVSVAPVSPAVAGDYTLSGSQLTIPEGATASTGTVTITAVDNAVDAPHKTVTVSATATNTQGITDPEAVTLTITDDENVAPTGAPTIDDTSPVVGETLTVDTSGIGDSDGLAGAAYAYRWLRVAAGGAVTQVGTGESYTVVDADVGSTLKVEVTFTDEGGAKETIESVATAAAEAVPTTPTPTTIFDADENYSVITQYGRTTTVNLAEYLATGVASSAVSFEVDDQTDCGATRADYYQSVTVSGSTLSLVPNNLGHTHGSSTESETACVVTGTMGGQSEARTFSFRIPAPRGLTGVVPVVSVVDRQEDALGVQVRDPSGLGSSWLRLSWRKTGTSNWVHRIMSGARLRRAEPPVIRIGGLESGTSYTVQAAVLRREAFDYHANGRTIAERVLATLEGQGAWLANIRGGGQSDVGLAEAMTTTGEPVFLRASVNGDVLTVTMNEALDGASVPAASAFTVSGGHAVSAVAVSGSSLTLTLGSFVGADETVTVSYAVPGSGQLQDDEGNAAPAFTDEAVANETPTVTLVLTPDTIGEDGGSSTVTATLDKPSPQATTVTVAAPSSGAGYSLSTNRELTIAANALTSTGVVTITAEDNDVDAPNKTVAVSAAAQNSQGVSGPDDVTLTLTDDDDAPTVTLVLTPDTITEAGGVSMVTARLSHPSSEETRLTVQTAPMSPAVAGDYILTAVPLLSIPAGETESESLNQVRITAVDNDVMAPDKTVTVSATAKNRQGVTGPQNVTLTITDNAAPTGAPTIDDTTPVVGETLTVDASGIDDADGLTGATYAWRWLRVASGGTETEVGTAASYTVVAADVRSTLKVEASFTDDGGAAETVESAETSTVAPAAVLPSVSVRRVKTPVKEGEDAEFRVTRTVVTAGALTVRYKVSESGAMVASGEEGAKTVDFGDGETSKTVAVPTVDDSVHEAGSTVTFRLTPDAYYEVGAAASGVRVEDDDNSPTTGEVTVTGTATEGRTLTADTSGLTDEDGLADTSYAYQWVRTPAGGSDGDISGATSKTYVVVFADAGATLKVRVTVTDDEGHEATFTSTPTSAVAALPRLSVTSEGDVTEGSPALFTLTRTGATAQTLDVPYEVAATGDFGVTPGAGTASFLADSATVQVSVATTDDSTHEAHGSVTLTLTADTSADPAYVLGDPATATAAVRDDDNAAPTGELTIDDTTPVVGETLTADASGIDDPDGLTDEIDLQWLRVASGGGETEVGTGATYTVVAADVGATLKVKASFTDDGGTEETVESEETATVEAAPMLPALSISDARVNEGDTGSKTLDFTVTLDRAATETVTVEWATSDGTATAGTDYTAGNGTLTFSSGDSSKTVSVTVAGDNVDEPNETFEVTLTNPSGATLGDDTATGTIIDNDARPTVTLVLTPASISEDGGVSMVTARLDHPSSEDTTLTVETAPVSPAVAGDYTLTAVPLLSIPAGETESESTNQVRITAVDNSVYEGDKTVTVSAMVQNRQGVTAPQNVTLTITDDEPAPPELSIGDVSVDEGDTGSTTLDFTVTLDRAATETVTVEWATSDGTATAGTDYTAGNGTVTFSSGDSSKTVSVTVLGDEVDEPNETFEVTLTNPSGATLGDDTATGTITDDDATPTVTLVLTPASITEEASGQSTVTARLDHPSSEATTVTVTVAPESPAVAGDYTLSSNLELTIAAGATTSTGTVTITAVNNSVYEGDKTVTVSATATNTLGITAPQNVTLTITDDEPPPTPTTIFDADGNYSVITQYGRTTTVDLTAYLAEGVASSGVSFEVDDQTDCGATRADYYQSVTVSGSTLSLVPNNLGHTHGSSTESETACVVTGTMGGQSEARTFSFRIPAPRGLTGVVPVVSVVDRQEDALGVQVRDPSGLGSSWLRLSWRKTGTSNWVHRIMSGARLRRAEPPVIRIGGLESGTSYTVQAAVLRREAFDYYANGRTIAERVLTTLEGQGPWLANIRGGGQSEVVLAEAMTTTGEPVFLRASVNGDVLTVTMNEALDGASVPSASAFTLSGGRTVSGVAVSGSSLTLTLGSFVGADETVTVSYAVPGSGQLQDDEGNAAPAFTDEAVANETPTVTLVLTPSSIGENGETSTVTATLDKPSLQATTVTVAAPSSGAGYGLSANRELTIAANALTSTGVVTITAEDNDVDAPNKTVAVSAAAQNSQGVSGPDDVTLTITDDDDAPTVTLVLTPDTITEAGGVSMVTARLSHPSSEETRLTVQTAPMSPAVAGDYILTAVPLLSIPAGETESESLNQVRITAVDNDVMAPDKTVTVSATAKNRQGVTGPQNVTLTITDNAAPTGAPTIDDTTPVVGETLTVDASGIDDADGLTGATYAWRWLRVASGGTETEVGTAASYTVVAADVRSTLKVEASFTDDGGAEETVESAETSTVAPAAVLPSVSVRWVKTPVKEGEAAEFRVTRTVVTAGALTVRYKVSESGAMVASGEEGAKTVDFGDGETSKTVAVPTVDDSVHEAGSTVTFRLTPDAYYEVGAAASGVRVEDDDNSPTTGEVTVTGTATEGRTLTADTSGLTDEDGLADTSYAYQWVRTPAGGSDGDISGATSKTYVVVFADAGATLKVRVTVTDDEGHEATFTSTPTSAVAALPRLSVTSEGDVTEGSPALFTLTRTGATAQTLDVPYEVAATGDFGVTPGAGTASFLADSATVQVSVATTDDSTHEAHGSVTLTLTADTGADPAWVLGDPAAATAAVEDDDDSPATGSVTVTGTATEGETLTADTSGIADEDGLANAAYTYQWVRTPSGGSDEDISGETGATYVPVYADMGATLQVKVTVTDDEGHRAMFESAPTSAVAALPRPSVTVASDGDVTEGDTVTFTLTRTGATAQTLDVAWEVTATGDFGVTTGAGTATFLANNDTVQVTVATTDDGAHEVHGSVTVTLTADTGADPAYLLGAPSTATAAVEDNDDSPATGSVTVTGTATEGETLTADTSGLTDADGLDNAAYVYQWVRTPSGGSDTDISGATGATYVPVFADAGATLKVRVTVTDDEGHEATFTSAPTSAVAALPRPEVTVASDGDVTEGSPAVFTLTRTGATTGTLDVAYEVTATGDFGVTPSTGTATFPANSATVQVSVATTDDSTHEAHGSVTVTLTADTSAAPAYLLGAPSTATAAVQDDDDSSATGSVTVTGTPTEGETLTADTSGLTDADGLANASYAYRWVRTPPGGGNADISGATSQTYVPVFADVGATLKVRVTVTDDEGHQATFTSASTSAVAALPRPSVTVVSDGNVTEGDTVMFTLTRTGDPAQTLDVAYETTATGDFGVTPGAGTATFPANSATVRVSVVTTGDNTHEAHGSVTVTLTADTSADPAYLLGDPSTATAAVEDDDDSQATGSVTVTGTPTEGETLTADTSGIADEDGLDNAAYTWQWVRTPAGGSDADISGATGATYVPVYADMGATLKVRVTVTDDEGHEAEFESAATSAVAARARPSVTVASDGDVTEGSPALFTLTRTGATTGTLDVTWEVTATGDFGVTTGAGTASFPANSATVQVSVATTDDSTHEAHGSVMLTLTADTGADPAYLLGDPATATAAVEDDDDSPATGSVTVTGTATEGETLTADTSAIADEDGLDNADYAWQWVRTPSGGSDEDIFGATSQTYVAVFADAGATLKVKVTVTDDEGHEAEFESAPTSAVAALSRPSVTVVSDDDMTEGNPALFTLTRTGATTGTLDVTYDVTVSGDFGVTPGTDTAMFEAGSSTVQVSLTTTDDSTHEAHGSVTVTLTADTGADPAYLLGDPSTATAAVEDDDDSPATGSVTVTGTATEGETLTADTSAIADEDGLDNADYAWQWVRTPAGGSDENISGATSQTYVPVFADMGATLKVKVTVTDDEGHRATFESAPTSAVAALSRPSVTVVSDGDVAEGDTVMFTLTRTGDPAQTLDVAYAVTATGDFGVTPFSGTAMFMADSSTVQVTVATTGDSTHEAHGSVTLTLTADTSADPAYLLGDPAAATATVRDDDDSPATGSVTVTGTATEGETLTADTSGLTDEDGLDNAAYAWQWVRTPAGGGDADISGATGATYVPVYADMGATLKVKVTVTDDEGHQATFESAPTLEVAAASRPSVTVVSDGDVAEGDTVMFTLTRAGDTVQTLDVTYEVTATGAFGVTTGTGTASFLANDSTVQVSVATTDDSTHEAHGSVTLTLTADTGADPAYLLGDPATATATVRDDDNADPTGAPTIDDTTPVVGQTLTVDPSGIGDPDGLTNRSFTYQWFRVSGGTETPITGATAASYTVAAGDVGATLKVVVSFTDDDGTRETVEIVMASAVVVALPTVSVARVASLVAEGADAQFKVTRTGVTEGALTVRYRVSETGGDMVAPGEEGEEGEKTVDFGDGEAERTVTVPTVDDSVHEADSTVTLTLTADAAYSLGTATATVTVEDNDTEPTVTLVLSPDTIDENGGTSTVTARLDHPSSEKTTVTVSVKPVLPAVTDDYTLSANRELTIAAGETTSTGEVTITGVDNDVEAPDKTVTVSGTATNSQGVTDPDAVTLTLRDNDLVDGRRRRLEYALASFGRTVAQDLVTAVEDRRWATGTTATLAGTRLSLSEEAVYEALRRHTDPDGDLMVDTAALREMLSRSSFQVSLGGEGEAGGMGADSLVLWGRGSRSWRAGRLEADVETQGEALSGQLGVEFRVREDTLVGVMLNGSEGEVEFDGALDTEVETELVGVHPYARWSPWQGLRTWAMVGYGAGEATLTDKYSALSGTDLEMMMAAGGGSHEVASRWGVDWSVGTNGFVVQLDADEVQFDGEGQAALVPAVQSEVWQLRLLLEGSAGEDFGGVEGLRGNVELAARVDGGDAESGLGMEVGGGVGYGRSDLGIEVDASGRVLLTHEEEGLEDAGVSLALAVDPGEPGRGPYFALSPSWGNAASGARSMWEDRQPTVGGSGGRYRFEPEMRLSSELGYAAPTPLRRGTLTTYGAFSSAGGTSRQYRIGRRLELGIASMSLEAERHESAGAAPEHGVWLRGNLRF